MFDAALAVKNAQKQKQAQARETPAASQKNDTGTSRFSDYVDSAGGNDAEQTTNHTEVQERKRRVQTEQMRARTAGNSVNIAALPEQPATTVSKVAVGEEPMVKDQPATPDSAPDAGKADAKDKVAQEANPVADKDTTKDGDKDKGDAVPAEEPVTPVVAEAPQIMAPVVPQAGAAIPVVDTPQPAPTDGEVPVVGQVSGAVQKAPIDGAVTLVAPAAVAAGQSTVATVETEAAPSAEMAAPLSPEELLAARATQKEAPKPAVATASLAQDQAIPDILQAAIAKVQPKAAETAKAQSVSMPKATAKTENKTENKTDEKGAAAAAAVAQPVQQPDSPLPPKPVDSQKVETKTGSNDQPAVEPSKEPVARNEASPAEQVSAPSAAPVAPHQADVVPKTPELTPVAASDGSRLSLTPSTQQAAPAAQTQSTGPLVPLNHLAVSIATKAMGGSTRFDIRLDPPELGRIDVRLTLDREGRVKSTMVIEKRETYELMQRDHRGLETAMQQAGLKMNDGSVEFTLRDQTAGNQQNSSGNPFGDREGRPGQRQTGEDQRLEIGPADTTLQIYAALAQQRGGVDLRI